MDSESYSMNWYLTQVINAIDKDEFDVQIPNDKLSILQDENYLSRFQEYIVEHAIHMKYHIVRIADEN